MSKEAANREELEEVYFDVICYKGKVKDVEWKDEDEGACSRLLSTNW
jgi:hypothetical protein